MNDLKYLKELFGKFSYPRVKKSQKVKARQQLIKEFEEIGYKAGEHIYKDNRIGNKIFTLDFAHGNYNIETECEKPEYIVSAHYDNPGEIHSYYFSYFSRSFGNKNKLDKTLSLGMPMILLILLLYTCSVGVMLTLGLYYKIKFIGRMSFNDVFYISSCISYVLFLSLFLFLKYASIISKKNVPGADDNTSGVVAVLSIAKELKKSGIENVKFILFDNEEKGLCGSSSYLKKNEIDKNIKIINLDSVGRGSNIFVTSDKDSDLKTDLMKFLEDSQIQYVERNKSFSDCRTFSKKGYMALSIVRGDVYYYKGKKVINIPWIHTIHDTIENIDFKRLLEVVNVVVDFINPNKSSNLED